jgi:hypothetical protein
MSTPGTCDCGWKTPKNVVLLVLDDNEIIQEAELLYDCPQCGCERGLRLFYKHQMLKEETQ